MAKKNLMGKLRASLEAEAVRTEDRFEKADTALLRPLTTAQEASRAALNRPGASKARPRSRSVRRQGPSGGVVGSRASESAVMMSRESISFTPEEQELLGRLHDRVRSQGHYDVTRSQMWRAGLKLLTDLSPTKLVSLVVQIERGRTGRPTSVKDEA